MLKMKLYAVIIFALYGVAYSFDSSVPLIKHHYEKRSLNKEDLRLCDLTQCNRTLVRCDGVVDCEDGCDEDPNLCDSLSKSCVLPENMPDEYSLNCTGPNPDTNQVPEMTLLSFKCNSDDRSERFHSICLNKIWTPKILSCTKYCPKLNNPNIQCDLNDNRISCDDDFLPSTELSISCTLPHHQSSHSRITCDENGQWDANDVKCEPMCGRYDDGDKQIPWNVRVRIMGIRHDRTKNYAGTLVSSNLILTLVPISFDNSSDEILETNLEVQTNDLEVQTNDLKVYHVNQIFRSDYEKHVGTIYRDIAILHLKGNVEIEKNVQPVCLDRSNMILPYLTSRNLSGLAMTALKKKGNNEEFAPIPFKLNGIRDEYQFFGEVTAKSGSQSAAFNEKLDVTPGSGFFFKDSESGLFYIGGVHQNQPSFNKTKAFINLEPIAINHWLTHIDQNITNSGSEDSDLKNATYADDPVFRYEPWEFRCDNKILNITYIEGCRLPFKNEFDFDYEVKHDKLDKYDMAVNTNEGAWVPHETNLIIRCDWGYSLLHADAKISKCEMGQWNPQLEPCKRTCRKLKPDGLSLKCTHEGSTINCEGPLVVGTQVTAECLPGYVQESIANNVLSCNEEGEWSGVLSRCIPVCGHFGPTNFAPRDDYGKKFPWNVVIYHKVEKSRKAFGTIISKHTILTAARPFYDSENDKILHVNDFVVVVGESNFNFEIDARNDSIYELDSLYTKNYHGELWKYLNDLVIVRTKTKISFNANVFPVCISLNKPRYSDISVQFGVLHSNYVSEILSSLYMSNAECMEKVSKETKEYVLDDKSCVSLNKINKSVELAVGGGIFHYVQERSAFYIVGVHSFTHKQTGIFTDIGYVISWIHDIHTQCGSKCELPVVSQYKSRSKTKLLRNYCERDTRYQ